MNHALEIITILGPIVIKSDGYAITSLNFGQIRSKTPQKTLPVLNEASKQLYSYFKNISFKRGCTHKECRQYKKFIYPTKMSTPFV